MTDELTVRGIECYGYHGVFEHEKREGQPFVVDLTLGLDTRDRQLVRALFGHGVAPVRDGVRFHRARARSAS